MSQKRLFAPSFVPLLLAFLLTGTLLYLDLSDIPDYFLLTSDNLFTEVLYYILFVSAITGLTSALYLYKNQTRFAIGRNFFYIFIGFSLNVFIALVWVLNARASLFDSLVSSTMMLYLFA
ncbi:MAG: hypothetical protein HYT34_02100 [Candidatus Ryanbacteria bacterium]|nr:hypothetical protein [Candidatus Ryanbacteria bacterium]